MSSRVKTLERLAALYKVVEHANGIALDQARGALHDVEARIREQTAAASRLDEASREALRRCELDEWQLDQSEREFAEWNRAAFEGLRQSREEAMRSAAEVYQASRMQLEQIESVLGKVRSLLAAQKERLEQRASDDRFLSRQRWREHGAARRKSKAEGAEPDGDAIDPEGHT
jgi:hypothetical protein